MGLVGVFEWVIRVVEYLGLGGFDLGYVGCFEEGGGGEGLSRDGGGGDGVVVGLVEGYWLRGVEGVDLFVGGGGGYCVWWDVCMGWWDGGDWWGRGIWEVWWIWLWRGVFMKIFKRF